MSPQEKSALQGVGLLRAVWACSDSLFIDEIGPDKGTQRPIQLRHPFVFYLGHLAAFSWNIFRRHGERRKGPVNEQWDILFSRGMDPDVEDPEQCHDHPAAPEKWPTWPEVMSYRDKARAALIKHAETQSVPPYVFTLVAEHDLMHIETLYYMMAQGAADNLVRKLKMPGHTAALAEVRNEWVNVPQGVAVLGRKREGVNRSTVDFGWDNEYGEQQVKVSSFEVKRYPVTVGEYAQFVAGKGYENRDYWDDDDWRWITKEGIRHPGGWRQCKCAEKKSGKPVSTWHILTVDGPVEAEEALRWPVSTSLAEARAYARWAGAELLSEAEWDRAAFGDEEEAPWGKEYPTGQIHGNFGGLLRRPVPIGSFPSGASWCGVQDLFGNGWELVDTVFAPFPGFKPMEDYKEYSADFFDEKHYVLKGASWATDAMLVRRSFRNFYQARYPYVFSKFRLKQLSGRRPTAVKM